MRVLFVVQRYGAEIAGGAEAACRMVAEHMVGEHTVEVVTSCALNYTDWANHFAAGTSMVNGVAVHRLPVAMPRLHDRFGPVHFQLLRRRGPEPLALQQLWARLEGPWMPELVPWLRARCHDYDTIIFYTYLYPPAIFGLPAVAGRVPTIFQTTAHDEPPFHFPLFDTLFRHADALAFFTPEEQDLVQNRLGRERPSAVTGIGIDLVEHGNQARFRRRLGIGTEPYLIYLGRVDPMKGSIEGYEFFTAYKERNTGPLKLVVVGEQVHRMPPHPDVLYTGFVEEATKADALAGATALLQPSYYESFSIVLCEAFVQGVPGLVQGQCAVLAGQARRSGGAIPFRGFAEFEAAVDLLVGDATIGRSLGAAGRRYVEREYRWPAVLDRYTTLFDNATTEFSRRRFRWGAAPAAGRASRRLDIPARTN
jgi:glycosyltransferase involved in cell wall biosynthesis